MHKGPVCKLEQNLSDFHKKIVRRILCNIIQPQIRTKMSKLISSILTVKTNRPEPVLAQPTFYIFAATGLCSARYACVFLHNIFHIKHLAKLKFYNQFQFKNVIFPNHCPLFLWNLKTSHFIKIQSPKTTKIDIFQTTLLYIFRHNKIQKPIYNLLKITTAIKINKFTFILV